MAGTRNESEVSPLVFELFKACAYRSGHFQKEGYLP